MKAMLIVDAATQIPALAFRLDEPSLDALDQAARDSSPLDHGYLCEAILQRAGFGRGVEEQRAYVVVVRLGSHVRAEHDPFAWDDLTMTCAHRWLLEHFDEHPAGAAIDVEPMRLALVEGSADGRRWWEDAG